MDLGPQYDGSSGEGAVTVRIPQSGAVHTTDSGASGLGDQAVRSARVSTTRERRDARAERLRAWAGGQERKGTQRLAAAQATADMIPFGQPILVGHYSERGDRKRRDRMVANMGKGIEHQRKAESMRSRADNIEAAAEHAIYSDDHDAIERLEERIAGLEAERARIKAYNASCRKGARDLSLLDETQRAELVTLARVCSFQLGPQGQMPSYVAANLSGNISKQRARLAELKRSAS